MLFCGILCYIVCAAICDFKFPWLLNNRFISVLLQNMLSQYLGCSRSSFIALLHDLLKFDPSERLTAREALEHPFFRIPTWGNQSELRLIFMSMGFFGSWFRIWVFYLSCNINVVQCNVYSFMKSNLSLKNFNGPWSWGSTSIKNLDGILLF